MMTNRGRVFAVTALALVLTFGTNLNEAHAQGPEGKNFGLGIALGNPTSITGKYYLQSSSFLDFHLGAYRLYDRRYWEESLFLAGDYVFEVYNFHEGSTVSFPFYVGIGGGLIVDADDDDRDCYYRYGDRICDDRGDHLEFAIGPRVPVGVAAQFQSAPFEIFLEFSPSLYLAFYDDRYDDDVDIDIEFLNLSLGGRFYF